MRLAVLLAATILCAPCSVTAAISSTMIVEMREITSVSVSPNGQLVVFGIGHSNPKANKRELSWLILSLHDRSPPKAVEGGEEIYDGSLPDTALITRQALWSTDGKWFFYLRRDGEEVQIWETRSDGRISRQVTHSTSDVMDLKRSTNPDVFIVRLAPDRAALRRAEEEEYRNGVLYDDHVIGGFPLTRTQLIIDRWRTMKASDNGEWVPPGWSGWTTAAFDVRSRKLRIASGPYPKSFAAGENGSNRVAVVAIGPIPKDPRDYGDQYTLEFEPKTGSGSTVKCKIAECVANRITVIGWSPDGTKVYYLADSLGGPPSSRFPGGAAIYSWNPHDNVVRLIYDSGKEGLWGRLYNFVAPVGLSYVPSPIVGRELVVAFAGADQPPRLVAINLVTGASRTLFDPNAELRSLTHGRAVWRTWDTPIGYSGRGIMVLPDDYRVGERYPAVITTYGCGNGFLHGGTGDNAPEFVLARQGFIAICVDVRVREIIAREPDQSRIHPVFCSIVLGLVADLTKDGKLDSTRVGLTGQSLGANAGAYCISHSNAFAAAAFRHGSAPEPARWELFDTNIWERAPESFYGQMNMPDPHNDPTGRWNEMSVSRRASEINTPTLIQEDDVEYLGALPMWSAMHEAGKAIEMHVFPEEEHLLIQPAHILINFERQLDWFKFWLKHEEDAVPSKRSQYDRWNRLRELARSSTSHQ